jgi:hypothetical protein
LTAAAPQPISSSYLLKSNTGDSAKAGKEPQLSLMEVIQQHYPQHGVQTLSARTQGITGTGIFAKTNGDAVGNADNASNLAVSCRDRSRVELGHPKLGKFLDF